MKQVTGMSREVKTYTIQIWVGLREGYSETVHSIDDVRGICDMYVSKHKDCVSITPTEFRYVDGSEPGVIVGLINYPRFPKTKEDMHLSAAILGHMLMTGLGQQRISIVTPKKTYMLENQ